MSDETVYLSTLQFGWGGLFDFDTADNYTVHLVRGTRRGTPGPTLCGIDRFAKDGPGWSVGGGVTGPNITHTPCSECVAAARFMLPGLPVTGIGSQQVAEQLGVPHYHHSSDALQKAQEHGAT